MFNQTQKLTVELIEASWHQTMIECVQGADFLTTNNTIANQIITNGWVSSLWQFISEYKITINRVCKKFHRDLRSETDSYIMLDLVDCKRKWSKDELEQFNNCRLYLRVELLSDMMTADGSSIRRSIWNGTKDKGQENFSMIYCEPRFPNGSAWNI
jgi:hypothetical protein